MFRRETFAGFDPLFHHYGNPAVQTGKGHAVPTYEMVALAEFKTEREIEQILQDADDAIMLEAWSRIDTFIGAERVA